MSTSVISPYGVIYSGRFRLHFQIMPQKKVHCWHYIRFSANERLLATVHLLNVFYLEFFFGVGLTLSVVTPDSVAHWMMEPLAVRMTHFGNALYWTQGYDSLTWWSYDTSNQNMTREVFTLFIPETPEGFYGLKPFTHPSIGIVVSWYWDHFQWTIPLKSCTLFQIEQLKAKRSLSGHLTSGL